MIRLKATSTRHWAAAAGGVAARCLLLQPHAPDFFLYFLTFCFKEVWCEAESGQYITVMLTHCTFSLVDNFLL